MAEDLFKNVAAKAAPVEKLETAKVPEKPAEPVAEIKEVPASLGSTEEITDNSSDNDDDNDDLKMPDELAMLKQRAGLMGLTFSNNIGLEALRLKIAEKMEGKEKEVVEQKDEIVASNTKEAVAVAPKAKTPNLRNYMRTEKMKLVRLRITNLDPKKKDLPGEILTVANEFLGTVRKYIPYGEVTDNGYHVPYCLFETLRDRKFLSIKTRKDRRTGQTIVEQQMAKEFALEILPQLTTEELARISASQLSSGGIDN